MIVDTCIFRDFTTTKAELSIVPILAHGRIAHSLENLVKKNLGYGVNSGRQVRHY